MRPGVFSGFPLQFLVNEEFTGLTLEERYDRVILLHEKNFFDYCADASNLTSSTGSCIRCHTGVWCGVCKSWSY